MPENTPDPLLGQKTFSISELNRFVKNLLEVHLPLIWVEGEISNFSAPGSGHWYFSLKDEKAQVRCAMFKGRNMRVNFKPKAGTKVRIRARVSLYEGRGEYQIIAEHMEDAGFGLLQQRYEALKLQLSNEGLFDESKKRPLPKHARHIAVITSPTGAAITDVLSVINRRFPAQRLTIIPTLVQGESAPDDILKALQTVKELNHFDVVLLCRGGGSIEDLWAFNSEKIARAVSDYPIPVVSAVGHEIDFTIADFVADLRAPTPSAAAEILTPNQDEINTQLLALQDRLRICIDRAIKNNSNKIDLLRAKIKHPLDKLNGLSQHLDHLESRLANSAHKKIYEYDKTVSTLTSNLFHLHPKKNIEKLEQQLIGLNANLINNMQRLIIEKKNQFNNATHLLEVASPLATLNRGYAIAKNDQDKVITSFKEIKVKDKLTIHLAEGSAKATVTKLLSE